MSPKPKKKSKLVDVETVIPQLLEEGSFSVSSHCQTRLTERGLGPDDIREVVCSGRREASKDEWKAEYDDWNYAFRGKAVNSDDVRVAVRSEKVVMKTQGLSLSPLST